MVLGLSGAALPPRTRRALPENGACGQTTAPPAVPEEPPSMIRVHSNSGLMGLPSAYHDAGAGQTAADLVETPCGEPPQLLQPAASDHSQMQHGSDRGCTPQHAAVNSRLQPRLLLPQQHESLQGSLAQAVLGAELRAELRQQQQQQQQQQPEGEGAVGPAAAPVIRRRQGAKRAQHVGSTRPQRTRLGAAAAGTAAAGGPSAKRQKTSVAAGRGGSGGTGAHISPSQHHKHSPYADVLHRTVVVPGSVFFVDTPGQVYVGRVNKAESGRRVPSVEVQFRDDASKYWFPVSDVRGWMASMVQSGCWETYNPGLLPPDFHATAAGEDEGDAEEEAAAAQALQSLSASMASSRRAGPEGSQGVQPAVSSRVQGRDSRAQQRGRSRQAGASEDGSHMQLLASAAGEGSLTM